MFDTSRLYEEQWIIWNGSLGIRDFVTLGRVEVDAGSTHAWLEEPYDMVGPLCLETLESEGKIAFAKCVVMTREQWARDQVRLRQEAFEKMRRAQEEMYEELERFNREKQRRAAQGFQCSERAHRELLELPLEGALEVSQIKSAYRQVVKVAHPDVGGSEEGFIEITEAYEILMMEFS